MSAIQNFSNNLTVAQNSSSSMLTWSKDIEPADEKLYASDPYKEATITVLTKENTPLQVTIKKGIDRLISFTAEAIINGQSTLLGYITLHLVKTLPDGEYGHDISPRVYPTYYEDKYGLEQVSRVNKIYVCMLESLYRDEYKGVGTALMQAAMEYGYSKSCSGRIDLLAGKASHGFYYKLGMRTTKPEIDNLIKEQIRTMEGFGEHNMYMPLTARQNWISKISEKPIFPITLEMLKG